MERETIIYKGFKFHRYPNSKKLADQRYFKGWVKIGDQQVKTYLHRFIWQWYNGEVPAGFHIHHADGDFNNNDISNLVCIEGSEHLSEHSKNASEEIKAIRIKTLHENRHKASEWHGSDEGRRWHSEHYHKSIKRDEEAICKECGQTYRKKISRSSFCSTRCKNRYCAAAARNRYKTPETAICEICGTVFKPKPNNAGRFCSRECYQISRKGLQP